MPRILHLIHGLTMGGAEIDLLRKSRALLQNYGYDLTIGYLLRRGILASQAEAMGISLLGPLMTQRNDPMAFFKLRQIFLTGKWDLIHSHLFAANALAATVAATLPHHPPLIAAEHALADRWGRVVLLTDRYLIQRQVARILVPSQATAASYTACGIAPQRLYILPNAVDVQRFVSVNHVQARQTVRHSLGLPMGSLIVGTICRLQPIKGVPLLIEAVRTIPQVHLIIIGDGPQRDSLVTLIHAMNLEQRVHLLGTRTDTPQLLAAMDIFALASYSETFGIVIAEALLTDTPVIATRVGGIPEVTQEDRYARLVPPGDVLALQQALRQTLSHLPSARQQARDGHAFIQQTFSVPVVAAKQHQFYQEILTQ